MPTPERTVARFAMTSDPAELGRMRSWLWTQLVGQALPLDDCSAVIVAVGELCNNAIKHAYQGASGHPIVIALTTLPDRVVVEVEDEGAAYDPRGYAPPDLEALPERGLGLFLVRQSVDDVTFDTARPRGTRWTLVKYRAKPSASPPA